MCLENTWQQAGLGPSIVGGSKLGRSVQELHCCRYSLQHCCLEFLFLNYHQVAAIFIMRLYRTELRNFPKLGGVTPAEYFSKFISTLSIQLMMHTTQHPWLLLHQERKVGVTETENLCEVVTSITASIENQKLFFLIVNFLYNKCHFFIQFESLWTWSCLAYLIIWIYNTIQNVCALHL